MNDTPLEPDRPVVPVRWQDLLDAHQSAPSGLPGLTPHLRVDTGQVTCEVMLESSVMEQLTARGLLLALPVKGPQASWEQRRRFAATLCDVDLRSQLTETLDGPDPFAAFDRCLAEVPIEATRWLEVERLEDTERLGRWLNRAGFAPDPPPNMVRKIIEFPFARARREGS